MTQPKALHLASMLEFVDSATDLPKRCAEELRRLHAVNAQLVEALETCVCAMQDYQAGIGITAMFDVGERMGRAALKAAKEKA